MGNGTPGGVCGLPVALKNVRDAFVGFGTGDSRVRDHNVGHIILVRVRQLSFAERMREDETDF
jgi:hypothetical protein